MGEKLFIAVAEECSPSPWDKAFLQKLAYEEINDPYDLHVSHGRSSSDGTMTHRYAFFH